MMEVEALQPWGAIRRERAIEIVDFHHRPLLSAVESRLLLMAEAGVGGSEMARHLGESLADTATRMRRIRERLRVSSTAQAVTAARSRGLLEDVEVDLRVQG